MRVQLLHVPGCPGTRRLLERLAQVLSGRTDVCLDRRVVTDEREAVELGMTGSPTLLVDGVDPFAGPDRRPSVSCRLYRDEDGSLAGSPSLAQLRAELDRW